MVSAGANGCWRFRHSALVTLLQGWPRGRRSPGLWAAAPDLGPAVTVATRRKALDAALGRERGRPSPALFAFGMLHNPVTSTPFSVNDILKLEREQIGLEALQLWGAPRSPESSQYLRLFPEPRGPEVHNTGSGSGDRRQNGSELPGVSCETVIEMVAERIGGPRE